MFERFTERARKVIILAREEAIRLGHNFVGTEHLLLGLIREGDGLAVAILKKLNVSISALKAEIEKVVAVGTEFSPTGEIPFTPQAKKVLEYAISEARSLSHNYIGTEHLLLGLIREGEGIASLVLRDFGVSVAAAKTQAQELLGEQASKQTTSTRTPALDEFGVDLTALGRQDKLDPVIGRDAEIERVIQVLSRRKKNNPVLIGEAGVGKTAIVEGLALRIISSNVPETLLKKRVVQLDLAGMVAGTKYRGQFEERLKTVVKEIQQANNVIMFIDELHTLVGAGAAEGRSTPATCSSRRWRAASSSASGPPPWTSIGNTWKRIGRWSGASRPSTSVRPAWMRRFASCARSRTATRHTTRPSSPKRPWWRRRVCLSGTSRIAFSPTRPSM